MHHPSKFGEDTTSKTFDKNLNYICRHQGNGNSFPPYLCMDKVFSSLHVNLSAEVSKYLYGLYSRTEFLRWRFCRIVQIITGTEISWKIFWLFFNHSKWKHLNIEINFGNSFDVSISTPLYFYITMASNKQHKVLI